MTKKKKVRSADRLVRKAAKNLAILQGITFTEAKRLINKMIKESQQERKKRKLSH